MDTTLQKLAKKLADEERKIKEYKSRIRIKGIISNKGLTKSGNIRLTVKKDDYEIKFIILKNHKERFHLAERLSIGRAVSVLGIRKRIDRLAYVLTGALVFFAIVFGILYLIHASPFLVFNISIVGLLFLIFYLFGEVMSGEMAIVTGKKKQIVQRREERKEKLRLYHQGLIAFRKLWGGEGNEE